MDAAAAQLLRRRVRERAHAGHAGRDQPTLGIRPTRRRTRDLNQRPASARERSGAFAQEHERVTGGREPPSRRSCPCSPPRAAPPPKPPPEGRAAETALTSRSSGPSSAAACSRASRSWLRIGRVGADTERAFGLERLQVGGRPSDRRDACPGGEQVARDRAAEIACPEHDRGLAWSLTHDGRPDADGTPARSRAPRQRRELSTEPARPGLVVITNTIPSASPVFVHEAMPATCSTGEVRETGRDRTVGGVS